MHENTTPHRKSLTSRIKEAGNVLFMILLAVALFAALAYAVTQSTRSGGGDASREQAALGASQLSQYGTTIATAIQRMRISNSCTENQISFETAFNSGYTNSNAPSNYTCHVFRPEGGGVAPWKTVPSSILDTNWSASSITYGQYYFTAQFIVNNIGTDCMAATCTDLVILVPNIPLPVCRAVNEKLGYGSASISDGITNIYMSLYPPTTFSGNYTFANSGSQLGDNATIFAGKSSGCFINSVDQMPVYYHVLVER